MHLLKQFTLKRPIVASSSRIQFISAKPLLLSDSYPKGIKALTDVLKLHETVLGRREAETKENAIW